MMEGEGRSEAGKALGLLICGTLVYYHCAYRNSTILSLFSDVLIVLLCSLAILGLLFRQMNISVPVDPLEWQISQDAANSIFAWLANTVGAAESVLRVAATGHDKRLLFVFTCCQPLDDWSLALQLLMQDYACSAFTCLLRTHSQSEHAFLSYRGKEMAPVLKTIICKCRCSLKT
ncbi:hypothetical protein E1A91_A05G121700v1 [Gossypium mustelinum]|uniref:Reticulon domain-containing protein n=1 Tax=Gossypium mustelinum TaxID=34275 RepID=A0A5D2Z6V8_GOSMU|nr:hypothetical protein E1A91_A05G121700v1 [Gossypium mustelinum]